MKLIKSLATASLVALISLQSAAVNIRIIGHGGGYAEMQALTILSQLRILTFACLLRPESCGLASSDVAQHMHAYEIEFDLAAKGHLEFFNSPSEENAPRYLYGKDPLAMSINSSILYDQSGRAKSFEEIAGIVARGWLNRPDSLLWGWAPTTDHIIEKMFSQFLIEHEQMTFGESDSLVHHLRIKSDIHAFEPILAIETEHETTDLTPIIRKQLEQLSGSNCGDTLMVTHFNAIHSNHKNFIGHVFWVCNDQYKNARFAFSTTNDGDQFDPAKLKITLSNVQTIDSSCDGILKRKPTEKVPE